MTALATQRRRDRRASAAAEAAGVITEADYVKAIADGMEREVRRYEELVICTPTAWGNPGGFDDNVYGQCARECGRAIQWRPHAPADAEKVCIYCALADMRKAGGGGLEVTVTREVAEDLRRFMATRTP